MERRIVSFRQDDLGEWVAHLECGHRQHVRHRPPFHLRPWVEDEAGRSSRIGAPLDCPLCDRGEPPGEPHHQVAGGSGGDGAPVPEDGGDPACWAGLVCDECGAVLGPDPHRPGCLAVAAGRGPGG